MATPVHLFGTEEQKQAYLVPSIRGEKISCLGITEPDAGFDVSWYQDACAVRDGDGWVINGSKTYITNGHRAHFIVLVTKTDPDAGYDGFSLFLVDMDTPGVVREKRLEKLGMHASDTALLAFQTCTSLTRPCSARRARASTTSSVELQGERLIGAAGCVAGAQKAFDKTLQYAQERKAFGRLIGRFQAIRHKFADMATKIEAGRQMVYTAAWRFAGASTPSARSRWPSSTPRGWPAR